MKLNKERKISSPPFFLTYIISYMSINIHFMNVCVQHISTKGCTRLAVASDKVYQLLANGRWFSPGTLASSTTYAGRHDIAEILLKVALNTKNQSINIIQWKGRYFSIRLFNKKIYLWYSFLIVAWTLPPPPPHPSNWAVVVVIAW